MEEMMEEMEESQKEKKCQVQGCKRERSHLIQFKKQERWVCWYHFEQFNRARKRYCKYKKKGHKWGLKKARKELAQYFTQIKMPRISTKEIIERAKKRIKKSHNLKVSKYQKWGEKNWK